MEAHPDRWAFVWFSAGGEMRGRIVIARDEEGKEYEFPSVNMAVVHLNISPTTIRRYARDGGRIMTRIGLMEISIRDNIG